MNRTMMIAMALTSGCNLLAEPECRSTVFETSSNELVHTFDAFCGVSLSLYSDGPNVWLGDGSGLELRIHIEPLGIGETGAAEVDITVVDSLDTYRMVEGTCRADVTRHERSRDAATATFYLIEASVTCTDPFERRVTGPDYLEPFTIERLEFVTEYEVST
ncbi:MAG: hypothetical protein KTR31_37915 [Myxococcales bacterium]|nr:hypothetical protein [Myxococcales bacterium]